MVLLAYKEAENLRILLPEIIENVKKCGEEYEILVVDTVKPMDNTPEVCKNWGACYINQEEPGFGGAFRTAIKYANKDKFLIMDSDGSHQPKYIPDLYKKFTNGNYDVVIGSRYCAGGESNDAKSSQIMSHILNTAYRIALGISAHDLSTDFRIYKTDDLKNVELQCINYDVLQEVLLKIKLYRKDRRLDIGETPISFSKRLYGESKRRLIPFIISYIKTIFRLLAIRIGSLFNRCQQ